MASIAAWRSRAGELLPCGVNSALTSGAAFLAASQIVCRWLSRSLTVKLFSRAPSSRPSVRL